MAILQETDRAHFLERGYVIIPNAVPLHQVSQWQQLAWRRLGYDLDAPATWDKERVHLPPSRAVSVETFAPLAFAATGEVVGGAERIQAPYFWSDVFVHSLAEGVPADAFGSLITQCSEFEEITANASDVVLLHPFIGDLQFSPAKLRLTLSVSHCGSRAFMGAFCIL